MFSFVFYSDNFPCFPYFLLNFYFCKTEPREPEVILVLEERGSKYWMIAQVLFLYKHKVNKQTTSIWLLKWSFFTS